MREKSLTQKRLCLFTCSDEAGEQEVTHIRLITRPNKHWADNKNKQTLG